MSYYQNVFPWEFIGNWVLGDRQASLSFKCPANTGRGDEIVQSYGICNPTFDLSGNDLEGNSKGNLQIYYARDAVTGFKGWTLLTINIAGATAAATTLGEIVAKLNADATFATMFMANMPLHNASARPAITIKQIVPHVQFRFYIDNRAAETVLRFNERAGIAELPSYFDRHTVRRRFDFDDANNHLIDLSHVITEISSAADAVVTSQAHGLIDGDTIIVSNGNSIVSINSAGAAVDAVTSDTFKFDPAVNTSGGAKGNYGVWARLIDNALIANAVDKNGNTLGYTLAGVRRDYELLEGRSGLFMCQLSAGDPNATTPNSRPIRTIEWPVGATAGYMAKMIKYHYPIAGTSTPDVLTTEPYVLTAADIAAAVPPAAS